MKFSKACFLGVLVIGVASGSSCSKSSSEQAQQGRSIVCDPFNGKGTLTAENGIIGSIYQLDPATADSGTVASVQANGKLLDATIVLSQINLPTITFNQGFTTVDGRVVRLDGGVVLRDYFSLHLEGQIQLNGLADGVYQFGIIGDDGAILQIDDGSGFRVVVNGDGVHKTRLDIGTSADGVTLTSTSKIPFKLDYFQGPAQHLALTLIWRKVAEVGQVVDVDYPATAYDDPIAGPAVADNNVFFNPPAPTPAESLANATADYTAIFTRGWSIPAAGSFVLPANVTSNPCL